jgi:hypothetical protein
VPFAQLGQHFDLRRLEVRIEHGQCGQQHAGEAAGHGEAAVAAGGRHQQVVAGLVAGALARQFAVGIAGDVEEACMRHHVAHQLDGGRAFRAVAAAGKRDQQVGRSRRRYRAGWVSRLVVEMART